MDAVCFDMDGVIVDSERHWVPLENERIFPETVAEDGEDAPTASEIKGMNVRDLYGYLEENYQTTVSEEEFFEVYDDAASELYGERAELLEGFEDWVAELQAAGASVALVSSSPRRWIDIVLERFSLEFDAVVSAEEIDAESKPAPDIYLHAADRIDEKPEQSIAVEDSGHGVEAAASAGLHAIGFRTDENADQDLSSADEVVESPAALRETLTAHVEER